MPFAPAPEPRRKPTPYEASKAARRRSVCVLSRDQPIVWDGREALSRRRHGVRQRLRLWHALRDADGDGRPERRERDQKLDQDATAPCACRVLVGTARAAQVRASAVYVSRVCASMVHACTTPYEHYRYTLNQLMLLGQIRSLAQGVR